MVAVPVEPEPAPAVATGACGTRPANAGCRVDRNLPRDRGADAVAGEEAVAAGAPEVPARGRCPISIRCCSTFCAAKSSAPGIRGCPTSPPARPCRSPRPTPLLRAPCIPPHGAIAMVDILVIGHVPAPLEGWLYPSACVAETRRLTPRAWPCCAMRRPWWPGDGGAGEAAAAPAGCRCPWSSACAPCATCCRSPNSPDKLYDVPVEEESPSEAPAAGAPVDLPPV